MNCDAPPTSAVLSSQCALTSSIADSLWSDVVFQFSDDSSASANTSDSDSCESYGSHERITDLTDNSAHHHHHLIHHGDTISRQNPRRRALGSCTNRERCPPALVRQSDRKVSFVDSLVDSSTQIVEAIWPLSSVVCRSELGSKAVLPLRTFIQETLRRSRTSYSTLQVALYYLVLIKPHVPKYDLEPESSDGSIDRSLQCGRRMFLAALILASKYLQDRNYSARAWSKISGLNTQEINQNEIAFLLAVNWKLHIADDVFRRWTDIVLKLTPSPPSPSTGTSTRTYAQQLAKWKQLILKLEPELANLGVIYPVTSVSATASDLSALSPRSILNHPQDCRVASTPTAAVAATSVPTTYNAPRAIDPASRAPNTGYPVPAPTLLPTPQLTPQMNGFCTPAASAMSKFLGRSNAMGLAMAQAGSAGVTQTTMDRLGSINVSPQGSYPVRRSSLATSVSTASSPESMVSDTSRSSSISSMSSLASATFHNGSSRCGVPSRSRAARLWNDRVMSSKSSVPLAVSSIVENYSEPFMSASPDSYAIQEPKLGELALNTPLGRRESDLDASTRDAARTLQDIHDNHAPTPARKRSHSSSLNASLHENLWEIVAHQDRRDSAGMSWAVSLGSSPTTMSNAHSAAPAVPVFGRGAKRVCCSAEAASGFKSRGCTPRSACEEGASGMVF